MSYKIKIGDRVRFISYDLHRSRPHVYPESGTIGVVVAIGDDFDDDILIEWTRGSTSLDDTWWCHLSDVKLISHHTSRMKVKMNNYTK